jgi:hypothetical protein
MTSDNVFSDWLTSLVTFFDKTFYYTSLSFFLYKNMTVILLLHPKINCMTIPPVVPVKNFRTIPLCGNFSNHISRTFLSHSSHWFKLNDVMQVL